MIKSLADFKTATKRITKLLNTFDITHPDAFKLSNSAALNLMARILGYENYNTIKPVLEKMMPQGIKKMCKFVTYKETKKNEESRVNINYIVGYDTIVKNADNNQVRVRLDAENNASIFLEYNFNDISKANEMLYSIDKFMESQDVFLDLDLLYSQLQNTDNRSNQLNPNNSST